MTEQQIAPRKASCAIWALERLLLCMRALMTLQVLQSRKGATASGADMGPRLVCLGGRNVAIGAGLTIGLGLLLGLLGRSYRCEFRIGGSVSLADCEDLPGMSAGISLMLARSAKLGLWSRLCPTIASNSILVWFCSSPRTE